LARLLLNDINVAKVDPLRSRGLVLVAQASNQTTARDIERQGFLVATSTTSASSVVLARQVHPDVIVVTASLDDTDGVDVCRLLRADFFVARSVPIMLVVDNEPTPEQRVAAIRAGVWDFVSWGDTNDTIGIKLDTCVLAKRNIDEALAEKDVPSEARVFSSTGLARETRRLGALMSRVHGPIACVVFEWMDALPDPVAGSLIAKAARASDIVGALLPRRFGVVAPGTDAVGAVRFATRVGDKVRGYLDELAATRGNQSPAVRITAGYDAVANVRYSPIDPAGLIARATSAIRNGIPEREAQWLRAHASPQGLALER
jgi:CheY-like chemotaxis protein